MSLRNLIPLLAWMAGGMTAVAQVTPTLPTQAEVAVLSGAKLTDAFQIKNGFTNATVNVIVSLAPPADLLRANFKSKGSLEAVRPQIKQLQQNVLGALPAGDVKTGHLFDNMAGFSAEVSLAGLQALQAHPQVVAIEPVFTVDMNLAQGIPLMRANTYRSTYNGAGVAVAVCDTGVDYTHPRLGGGGFPNSKVLGGYDFGDNDANPMPNTQAHGTCCAGIVAGSLGTVGDYIGGVAYNAKIYALKISSGTGGSATSAAMAAAWDWCVTHQHDDPNNPIMVISTSFSGGQYFSACDGATPSMTTAANNAAAAGITVLASSGNDGYCNSMGWPACISSVISVGAVYDASFGTYQPCVSSDSCAPKTASGGCTTGYYASDATAADKVTSYANVASFLTLFAPANSCYTLDIVGSSGYSTGDYYPSFGGTSAACPYAAGAVACLQSAARALTGSYLTPAEVKSRLLATGNNVTDTKVAITKPRVNLANAIESLETNSITDLKISSVTLVGGNSNQSVDPNECNDLRVILHNDGNTTATNVTVTLTAATPGVTVLLSNATYPDIGPFASATNATLFKISTAPSFVCGTLVNVTLAVNHSGGSATNIVNLVSGTTNYVITPTTGANIVPGVTDVGNHGDDVTTAISLPFAYTFYGQTFSNATVCANGTLQFSSANNGHANACLPATSFTDTIFAHWDDLRTDGNNTTLGTQGIYTSTTGAAPNRIFNIEWRASYYRANRNGNPLNFEVRLYEGRQQFEIIYGTLNGTGSGATVGAQKATGSTTAEYSCNAASLSEGLQLTFQQGCTDGGGSCATIIANFTATPTNGLAPLTVNFTNLSTGADAYDWDFGDGNASTNEHPSNTYSNAGSYSVLLTAIAAGGTNALTYSNLIIVTNPPPPPVVADFAADPTNGLTPLTVNFTNLTTGADTYAWDFGDSNTSTNVHPSNTYSNAGSYSVLLTAIGAGGTNALTHTNLIVVTNPPPPPAVADFAADPTNGLAPLLVAFTNLSTSADNYAWDFGDGNTSTNTNPSNTYSNAGSYSVLLTAIGAGGTNALTLTNLITVTNPPPPPVVVDFAANPTNGLAPLTVNFTNLTTGADDYAWDFGDGNSSTNEHPSNTYSNAGTYSVLLTAIGAGGTNALTRTNLIVVTNPPPPPVVVDFAADPTNGLAPLLVAFTNLSTGADNYAWDFGDGNTSTNEHPANTYTNAGAYSVTLTAIGADGTNALTQTNVIVVTNPPPPSMLLVAPAILDFGLVVTGLTAEASFVISNAGATTLVGSASGLAPEFAFTAGDVFSMAEATATNLPIQFAPTTPGVFSNLVVFTSNGGSSTNLAYGRSIGTLLILSTTLDGDEFQFSFETVAGVDYTIEYADSLVETNWQELLTAPGDGQVHTITNLTPASAQQYFRLRVP